MRALFLMLAAGGFLVASRVEAVWRPLDPGFIPQEIIVAPTNRLRWIARTGSATATSLDGGYSWTADPLLLPHDEILMFDGVDEHTLYRVDWNGVSRSVDDGATWTFRGAICETCSGSWTTLVFDPQQPDTLVADGDGHGVFRSSDGGVTWTLTASAFVGPIFVVPGSRSLFTYFLTGNQLRESTDGGHTWTTFTTGLPPWNNITGLAIDPSQNSRRYVSFARGLTGPGGVWVTSDAGITWTLSNAGFPPDLSVSGVALDASNPPVLYAATDTAGVFRSADGGVTWRPDTRGLPGGQPNHPSFNRPTSFDPGPFLFTWNGAFALARRTDFNVVFPCRAADTRSDGLGPLVPGAVRRISLVGACGIPAEAVSVVLNVTLVGAAGRGVISISPEDPSSSSTSCAAEVPFAPGRARATSMTMVLGPGGDVEFLPTGAPVDMVLDVSGFFR